MGARVDFVHFQIKYAVHDKSTHMSNISSKFKSSPSSSSGSALTWVKEVLGPNEADGAKAETEVSPRTRRATENFILILFKFIINVSYVVDSMTLSVRGMNRRTSFLVYHEAGRLHSIVLLLDFRSEI